MWFGIPAWSVFLLFFLIKSKSSCWKIKSGVGKSEIVKGEERELILFLPAICPFKITPFIPQTAFSCRERNVYLSRMGNRAAEKRI